VRRGRVRFQKMMMSIKYKKGMKMENMEMSMMMKKRKMNIPRLCQNRLNFK
jgi:hypothetical protein